jgi:hypothetical protein
MFAPLVIVAAETSDLSAFGGFGSLVGCKGSTARGMGGALSSVSGLFTKKANTSEDSAKNVAGGFLGSQTTASSVGSSAVPVESKDIASTAKSAAKTSDLSEKANTREECLNGLAYRVAKFALAKLTEQTVNWINTGFNGDPFFVRDPESYFKSIADQEINSILGPISKYQDLKKYPYGRDFAKSFLQNRANNYNNYSQSNLNSYLRENQTPAQYARNFSSGGWDGWLGLTQNPANNPLGFGMITSQEIADRQARSAQQTLNELNWGDGFLSQKKCVEPKDYTNSKAKDKPCTKWETVTPGIAISGQLSKVMGTSYNQLEMADQINESMSLVFDALTNQAMLWGVSKLSTKRDNSFTTFGGVGSNRIYNNTGEDITSTTGANISSGNSLNSPQSSGWFNQSEEFDITGVKNRSNNLAVVLENQKSYKKELSNTVEVIPNILPNVGELDYCIPGPNPNWTTDVEYKLSQQDSLQAKGINITDPEFQEISKGWGVAGNVLMIAGGVVSMTGIGAPIGMAIAGVGLLITSVSGWIGGKKQDEYNANKTIIEGIQEAEINMQNSLLAETAGIDREEYKKYKAAIEKYYSKNIPVAEKALGMTSNINNYKESVPEAIDAYGQTINETTVHINELLEIKRQVDDIMKQKYIQDQINACGTQAAPDLGTYGGGFSNVGGGGGPSTGGGSSGSSGNNGGGFIQFP